MSDISSLTIGKKIEIIGTFALASNTGMKSVKFKDGSKLKEIQAYAFFSCISLTDMQDLNLKVVFEKSSVGAKCAIFNCQFPISKSREKLLNNTIKLTKQFKLKKR